MKRLLLILLLLIPALHSSAFSIEPTKTTKDNVIVTEEPKQVITTFTHLMFSGTGKGADTTDLAKALNFIEPHPGQKSPEKKSKTLKKANDLFFLLKAINYTTDNIETLANDGKTATIELGEPGASITIPLVNTEKFGWIFSDKIFTDKEYSDALEHMSNVKANILGHADDFLLEYSSPLNTLYTFLYGVKNIHGYDLNDSVDAIDLSTMDKNIIDELGPTWAIQIYRILYYASPVRPESLSNDPLFTGNIILLLDPNFGMVSMTVVTDDETGKKSWKIDLSGVRGVSKVYDSFMNQGMAEQLGKMGVKKPTLHVIIDDFFQMNMPILEKTFLSINIWKWLLIVLLLLSCIIAIPLIRIIAKPIIHIILKPLKLSPSIEADQRFILPLQISAIALYLLRGIVIITASPTVMTVAILTLSVVMCLTILLFICRFIDSASMVAANRFNSNLHIITSVAGKVLKVIAVISAALYICDVFSIDTKNFLAALGIGGFAFALAGKDTLENFLGSIMIIADRPFKNGDIITINNISGEIEQVGVRSTRIRTFEDSVITIPNRMFISSPVDNLGMRRWRRYKTTFDILYDTSPDKIEDFTSGLTELIRLHPDSRKDKIQVYFYSLGASSLQVYISVFFRNIGRAEELKARQELNTHALELAKSLDIEFAYPTQTLYVNKVPDQAPLAHTTNAEDSGHSSGLSEGIQLARQLSPHYDPDTNE